MIPVKDTYRLTDYFNVMKAGFSSLFYFFKPSKFLICNKSFTQKNENPGFTFFIICTWP